MDVYVVVTLITNAATPLIGDVVLVTSSDHHAAVVADALRGRRPYPGLDYSRLSAAYSDATVIRRELTKII